MTRKRTRPRDRITQASCLLITALLIVSAVSAGVGTGMASAEPAGMVSVPDQNITEDIPADALVPLGASQLHDGRILTDSHAMSLDVILTTPARAGEITGTDTASLTGDMALILRDTEHSAGRRVAIDSGLLQTALGYEPQAIYGTHENGEQWTATATYNDGYLVFDVPHFSTNTVTFRGSVNVSMQSATDSTSVSWGLTASDSLSNPQVTVTGRASTSTKQYSNLDTDTVTSISVAGSQPATNAELTASVPATGSKQILTTPDGANPRLVADFDNDQNAEFIGYYYSNGGKLTIGYENSYDVTPHSMYSVRGNAFDVDNDGTVEAVYTNQYDSFEVYDLVDGERRDLGYITGKNPHFADFDGDGSNEMAYLSYSNRYIRVALDAFNGHQWESSTEFYNIDAGDFNEDGAAELVGPTANGNLAMYDPDSYEKTVIYGAQGNDPVTADFDGDNYAEVAVITDDLEIHDHTETYKVAADASGVADHSAGDVDNDGVAELVYIAHDASGIDAVFMYDYQSETTTKLTTVDSLPFGYLDNVNSVQDVDNDNIQEVVLPRSDGGIYTYQHSQQTQVAVDIGNDDSVESSATLSPGESTTLNIGSIPLSTSQIEVLGEPYAQNIDLSYQETALTKDVTLSLNGQTKQAVSGTLQSGATKTIEFDKTALQTGINTLEVNMASGSGGLQPSADIALSHSSTDKISANYSKTTFAEKYNVSHTVADETSDVTVEIPFASNRIVGIKRFEYRINGGEWQSVAPADRRFANTTATAYLSQANDGQLPAGATVEVRATGRKVNVENGKVAITDPTKPGEPLDTQLKIQSRSAGFSLNVGPTDDGDRIHYAYSSNYPTEDYVVIDRAGNQRLYLPESQPGDTFRMKHVRTKANVVSGDAKIRVVDPDDKKFEIMPGPGGDGDTVELTYYGTKPGNTYMLESLTREIILDTETANSPVTFVDDDSHEMWRILLESGGSGDTGGGGGLIGVASGAASNAGSAVSGLLPAISVPALGGIGGVGSAGFALALAGAVAVLVYGNVFGRIAGVIASLNPFGGTPASGGGADTGNGGIDTSGVTSALSGVVTRAGRVGGTAGVRVLRATTQLLTTSTRIIGRESARLARYLAANPSVALGLGGVGVAVAAYQGLVQLTPQATTAILIGSGGLITYLVLQRTETFSWLSFGLIFGAFVILGAGAINPDVLASFGASLQDILPLLVIVGAYVVYRILQTRSQDASTPDTIVRFTGGGSGSDDNNN